jgi:hypothetical protein
MSVMFRSQLRQRKLGLKSEGSLEKRCWEGCPFP